MKNFKKKAATFMSVVTALCLTVGTLAVFTDRFQAQTTATAGTLDISLTQSWADDNVTLTDAENQSYIGFKPGTALKLNYTLSNKGNMPADIHEMFVMTYGQALAEGKDRQFDLYKAEDITVDAKGNVLAIAGDALTPAYDAEKNVLTYKLEEHVMNAAAATAPTTHKDCYYLVFNQNVDNSFQDVNVKIEYLAQALQANNTGDDTWNAFETNYNNISETFVIGGQSTHVVPQHNAN